MMKFDRSVAVRRFTPIIFLVIIISAFIYSMIDFKQRYERKSTSLSSPMAVVVESDKLNSLRIKLSEGDWVVLDEVESSSMDSFFQKIGFPSGFEGYEVLYSYKIHKFSWFNIHQNLLEYQLASILSTMRPSSIDGIYHVNEKHNFGAIFISDERIVYHKKTVGRGIVEGLIIKKDALKNEYESEIIKKLNFPDF